MQIYYFLKDPKPAMLLVAMVYGLMFNVLIYSI